MAYNNLLLRRRRSIATACQPSANTSRWCVNASCFFAPRSPQKAQPPLQLATIYWPRGRLVARPGSAITDAMANEGASFLHITLIHYYWTLHT